MTHGLTSLLLYSEGDKFIEGDLEYIVIDAHNMYVTVLGMDTGADFTDRPLYIQSNIVYEGITYSVTEIASEDFVHCTKISTVNIPYGVKSTGFKAFKSSIVCVSIPER